MMRASCLSLWALLCFGCFSNADFAECSPANNRQPCGLNGVCSGAGEECVEMPFDVSDAGTGEGGEGGGQGGEGDGGVNVLELEALTEPLDLDEADAQHVIINTPTVTGKFATITGARIIQIRAGLVVNARGQDGGPGGGAGAGQDTRNTPFAQGGESSAQPGGAGDAQDPGDGGSGDNGSNVPGGSLSGGVGGDANLATGADGEHAVYLFTCADFRLGDQRLGGGGSGAGGGRGGPAMPNVCVGPGGGGGGAGGPGGGIIILEATEEIIISGTLDARGEAGGTGDPGRPGCASCGSCLADAGNGGDGASVADDLSGDEGGEGAGRGGRGGAGSGGLIVLRAPSIRFLPGAHINVMGGTGGPESSGLIYIDGASSVAPDLIVGASEDRRCVIP
ncbi:MAG: hypothetical protein ACI9U2_002593 [Bradymonadia bacterium]|jgi:hypothetical protein